MRLFPIVVITVSTIIISANATAKDLFEGNVFSKSWLSGTKSSQPTTGRSSENSQPDANSKQFTTYRSRGNGRFTGNDGSTLRSRSNGRLVDSNSGITYIDRGNGRLTGSNGSTCRDRGNGRIVCY